MLGRPAQGHGPLLEGVLALGALGVVEDLVESGLPDVQVGVPLEVVRPDLLMWIVAGHNHAKNSCLAVKTMFVSTVTSCPETDVGNAEEATVDEVCLGAGESLSSCRGQACIHAASPCRMNSASPQALLADHAPLTAVRRRSS